MVVQRREIWWAELRQPRGAEPGYRRPVLVVQADPFNKSGIGTVVVVTITSNARLSSAPGNVRLTRRQSKLPRASVVNVSQIFTLDRQFLTERVGQLPESTMQEVDRGLRLALAL